MICLFCRFPIVAKEDVEEITCTNCHATFQVMIEVVKPPQMEKYPVQQDSWVEYCSVCGIGYELNLKNKEASRKEHQKVCQIKLGQKSQIS